jgi:alkylation response protein AidB-like acyl-CoA dehydrogenase
MSEVLRARDVQFLLYEFLDTASLLQRDRYREHSLEVFNDTVEAARSIAEKYLLPHYQEADAREPRFDGERVHLHPATRVAWDVIRDSGFLKGGCDAEEGGLQLPEVIIRISLAYFLAANNASSAYPFLTWGVINLVRSFGRPEQKAKYLPILIEGTATGTMALTEASQGSALADIQTRAEPQADGTWRVRGQKMFISGGDHDLTGNIIHLVLARTQGTGSGVNGTSLFIVPKFLVNDDGSAGRRNDVALAGLLHKMGSRNSTSTVLNFGEKEGAVADLIGEQGRGLHAMFQMMNEARIGVGISAAVLALRGYLYSLQYAKERPQGRLPSTRSPSSPQVMLIEHADVRRLLLTQKAYGEGALALCMYAASLSEDERTLQDPVQRLNAGQLLSLLTPVVKSWPSRYGCQANDMAIQVLGGAGYIREHPVEQFYRDQRLNPIHEGAEAIHGLDILGRKVRQDNGAAVDLFARAVGDCIAQCSSFDPLKPLAASLQAHLDLLLATTRALVDQVNGDADAGLSNATLYLDVFGKVAIAWIWLRQAVVAQRALAGHVKAGDHAFYAGKVATARFYIEWELPTIEHTCRLLAQPNLLPLVLSADLL